MDSKALLIIAGTAYLPNNPYYFNGFLYIETIQALVILYEWIVHKTMYYGYFIFTIEPNEHISIS